MNLSSKIGQAIEKVRLQKNTALLLVVVATTLTTSPKIRVLAQTPLAPIHIHKHAGDVSIDVTYTPLEAEFGGHEKYSASMVATYQGVRMVGDPFTIAWGPTKTLGDIIPAMLNQSIELFMMAGYSEGGGSAYLGQNSSPVLIINVTTCGASCFHRNRVFQIVNDGTGERYLPSGQRVSAVDSLSPRPKLKDANHFQLTSIKFDGCDTYVFYAHIPDSPAKDENVAAVSNELFILRYGDQEHCHVEGRVPKVGDVVTIGTLDPQPVDARPGYPREGLTF